MASVLRQVLQPARTTGIPALFFHLLGAAQGEPGLSPRLIRSEAARDEVGGMLIQVKAQLLFQLVFHLVPAVQTSPPPHRAPPSMARMRPTASINRFQLAASASSCFRPVRVSR